jgi:hypothetical protein
VTEGGPVSVCIEVSDRIGTMEMKIDTALGTSIRSFITRQLTERTSTSDSGEPFMRSCVLDTASDEEEGINLRSGVALTEGIDKIAKSDTGSSATSTEPHHQVAEVSTSPNGTAASAETVSPKHNGMMQQLHQRVSSHLMIKTPWCRS